MADNPSADNQPKPDTQAPAKLLAGKYRSTDELEKGYENLMGEGLKQRDRATRAEAERDALKAELERANRAPRTDLIADKLREADIPIEALDARVEAKALDVIQQALKPLMDVQRAEMAVQEKFKDFPGAGEIQRNLDPDVAESYRSLLGTNPEAAMTLGYKAWKANQPAPKPAVDTEARTAASQAPKRGGGERGSGEPGFSKEKYGELLQNAVQTGDWTTFLRYRFGDTNWYKRIAEGRDEW